MASGKASWFQRNILFKIPFLYRRRDCGNYHPFWHRLCFCRMGAGHGIQDLRTGKQYTPAEEVQFTRELNTRGAQYNRALERVHTERRKLLQAVTFYMSLRDGKTDLFKVTDAINEMHCAIDRLAQAEDTVFSAWVEIRRQDRADDLAGKIGCHQDRGPCRACSNEKNPGSNAPHSNCTCTSGKP